MSGLVPRSLGASSTALSPIAFGSMRIHERPLDDDAWIGLLLASLERGVTTFHSSSEYESYARFCALLRKIDGRSIQHIVKLAEPHFGDASFSNDRLVAKIDAYLKDLGAETIDVVQWMWRGDLEDEANRLDGAARAWGELVEAFDRLRRAGKIGSVAPFPYTIGFADLVVERGGCEGLTIYLNPLEREMVPTLERAVAAKMGAVAIRPLAAGRALDSAGVAECVRSVLEHPGVATAVVSYSSASHLDELCGVASSIAT